jgi:DNA-binding transcriptional regulator YiaG
MAAIVGMIGATSKAGPQAKRRVKPSKVSRRPSRPERGRTVDPEPDVAQIRDLLALTQEDMARVLGYSTRSVAGWESGQQSVSASARLKLIETGRLARALAGLMPRAEVGAWLRTANSAFGGQMPMHLIELGQSDRLWQMIHQVDANVAN